MSPILGILHQRSQRLAGALEVVHGLEQRSDVEWHLILVHQSCDAGEVEHRQSIVRPFGHADDERAECALPKRSTELTERAKHLEGGSGLRVRGKRTALVAFFAISRRRGIASVSIFRRQCCSKDSFPLFAGSRCKLRIAHQLATDCPMHGTVLSRVQRRQVEPEGLHPAQQSSSSVQTAVLAAVLPQALDQQTCVCLELARSAVLGFLPTQRVAQKKTHAVEITVIRHVRTALVHVRGATDP